MLHTPLRCLVHKYLVADGNTCSIVFVSALSSSVPNYICSDTHNSNESMSLSNSVAICSKKVASFCVEEQDQEI